MKDLTKKQCARLHRLAILQVGTDKTALELIELSFGYIYAITLLYVSNDWSKDCYAYLVRTKRNCKNVLIRFWEHGKLKTNI